MSPETVAPTSKPGPAPGRKPALRRRSRALLFWGGALLLVIGGGYAWSRRSATAPLEVYTTKVLRGPVRDFVSSVASGRVSARREALLRAEIAGRVLALHKRRGETVKAGEPLLGYDAVELQERVRLAEAAVGLARAQLQQAQQSAAVAEASAARARRLAQSGSAPIAEAETLEGQAKTALRAADATRAAITQASANLELAKTALTKAVVRAPFDATVLVVSTEVGETIAPGTPLFQLADTSELHIDAELDEADVGRVRLGMPVDISFDAFPHERLRGKLTELAPSVTRDPRGGRSVAIDVAVPRDQRLRVGMSADVDIIVETRDAALYLPPNAVLGRGAERVVFVVEKGVAHQRKIETGISTWEAVEIRSGLSEGAEVAMSQTTAQLKDGAKVRVLTKPTEPGK